MTLSSHRAPTALVVAVVIAVAGLLVIAHPERGRSANRGSIKAYRGLGTWVDIHDTAKWNHPGRAVRTMHRLGVRTLFLETGNYSSDSAIFKPAAAGHFIQAAHARHMKVVAWYLPSFDHMHKDFRRAMAAIRFRTSAGQRFDSFGLDIEAPIVRPISERKDRMLRLSRRIRNAVGPSYPLSAIVPSPYGMRRVPDYWGDPRDFPYGKLASIYDVLAPMSYYTNRTSGRRQTHDYTEFNIRLIRRHSDREVPIHPIGGIANLSSRDETEGFVRAVREHGVIGGSMYDFATSTWEDWVELKYIPVNPRQSPALPIKLGESGYLPAIGNVSGADRSHPKEVFFETGGSPGKQQLTFEAFDVAHREVRVMVNWHTLTWIAPTPRGSWSAPQAITIPGRFFKNAGTNIIGIVAKGAHPAWNTWGVRNVRLQAVAPF